MHALVTDYEDFCSDEDLLPVDKWTMFVPPTGLSHEINVAQRLYFCPASWSRRKALGGCGRLGQFWVLASMSLAVAGLAHIV